MITSLALALALTTQAPVALDDPASNYCLATGYCRTDGTRRPASGVLFLAVGLVVIGSAGIRVGRRGPRRR